MMNNMRRIMTMALPVILLFSGLAQAKSRQAAIDEVSADLDKLMAAEQLEINTAEELKSNYGSGSLESDSPQA
jgi:hypothetical protein